MEINFKEYQGLSARTINQHFGRDQQLANFGMGLTGEAGEIVEILKKHLFHRHGLNAEKLKDELGDLLWYISAICNVLGFDMGQIASDNVEKLKKRYPEGFGFEESINRDG